MYSQNGYLLSLPTAQAGLSGRLGLNGGCIIQGCIILSNTVSYNEGINTCVIGKISLKLVK